MVHIVDFNEHEIYNVTRAVNNGEQHLLWDRHCIMVVQNFKLEKKLELLRLDFLGHINKKYHANLMK